MASAMPPIFVISLAREKVRRETMQKELAGREHDFEFFEATDGLKRLVARFLAIGPRSGLPEEELLYLDGGVFDFGRELKVALGPAAGSRQLFVGKISGIEVCFEDTGMGMSPEEIETFFQPSVSASQSQGTGLGLAVVYRILDRHGIKIEVDSEVGKGTRCLLTFAERAISTDSDEQQMVLMGGDPGGTAQMNAHGAGDE